MCTNQYQYREWPTCKVKKTEEWPTCKVKKTEEWLTQASISFEQEHKGEW